MTLGLAVSRFVIKSLQNRHNSTILDLYYVVMKEIMGLQISVYQSNTCPGGFTWVAWSGGAEIAKSVVSYSTKTAAMGKAVGALAEQMRKRGVEV